MLLSKLFSLTSLNYFRNLFSSFRGCNQKVLQSKELLIYTKWVFYKLLIKLYVLFTLIKPRPYVFFLQNPLQFTKYTFWPRNAFSNLFVFSVRSLLGRIRRGLEHLEQVIPIGGRGSQIEGRGSPFLYHICSIQQNLSCHFSLLSVTYYIREVFIVIVVVIIGVCSMLNS